MKSDYLFINLYISKRKVNINVNSSNSSKDIENRPKICLKT